MLPLLAIGAGGHLRVLLDALRLQPRAVLGIVDRDAAIHGTERYGLRVLGDDAIVLGYAPSELELVNAIGSVASTIRRQAVFLGFKQSGYSFTTVIHPAAMIAAGVHVGEGVQVMAGAILQPGVSLDDDCIVNSGVIVEHDCRIAAHAHLAPGVTLSGGVTVGEGAHLGTGATVIQGVNIGRGAIVAAGAVVTKDVRPGVLVMGVPAKERLR